MLGEETTRAPGLPPWPQGPDGRGQGDGRRPRAAFGFLRTPMPFAPAPPHTAVQDTFLHTHCCCVLATPLLTCARGPLTASALHLPDGQ